LDVADEQHVTGDALAMDARPAAYPLRAASAAIDVAATVIVAGLAIWLITASVPGDSATMTALVTIVLVGIVVVAPAVVETLTRGRSLGQLALGLRIVRDDGGAIGFRHAFIRALLGVFELYMTLGGTAAIVGLLSNRTKRLGDMLAGTYAMHERVGEPRQMIAIVPEPLLAWAAIADVARLPDSLARRIADYLRHAGAMGPESRARLARSLADEAAPYIHPLPAVPAEYLLPAVAAIRRDREAAALAREAAVMTRARPATAARRGIPDRG
jgi:uncharacterized RDD family membrane protein YckC